MNDSKQDALNAYWEAKTPDQEREAFARMTALGMLNDGSLTTILPPPTDDLSTIPVTPEMIAAGEKVWITCEDEDVECLQHVYRAMAAQAPVELVSPGELAALKERDEALAMRNETMAALTVMRAERDEGTARNLTLRAAFDRAEVELVTLRTRLAERDASLVKAARGRV